MMSTFICRHAFIRRYSDVFAVGCLILVYVLWPRLDLQVASWFYSKETGFEHKPSGILYFFYLVFSKTWVLAILFFLTLLLSIIPRFSRRFLPRRRAICYLLAVLIIGPGLIVESVKDSWGRARPKNVMQFKGDKEFSSPLIPSGQCRSNCSFVSGHAASGFSLMAGYWLTKKRRWIIAGIALGLSLGYIRMLMGGHFLSDVLFAGIIIHFTCRGLAMLFRIPAISCGKPSSLSSR